MKEGGNMERRKKASERKRKTEKGRDEEKERWPLQVQQHTGTEL